jgi:hypothetical protein
LANVQFLRELVEDGGITVLILFNDRDDERYQLVPKVDAIQARTVVIRFSFRLTGIRLPHYIIIVTIVIAAM